MFRGMCLQTHCKYRRMEGVDSFGLHVILTVSQDQTRMKTRMKLKHPGSGTHYSA